MAQEQDKAVEPWMVNDLCREHEAEHDAIIYRVIDVHTDRWGEEFLTLKPVHGVVVDIKDVRCTVLNAEYCKKLSLLDIAADYTSLGAFIANEAKRRSVEPPQHRPLPAVPSDQGEKTQVPSRNHGERPNFDVDDDHGLCTDISARDETLDSDDDQ